MNPSPNDILPKTQRPAWTLSAIVLLVALCCVAAAQSTAEQPLAIDEAAPVDQSTAVVLPPVTDPAELRSLAARFREAAESSAMNRELGEPERRKLMGLIVQGEALPRAPDEVETDPRHENSLHCLALAESLTREAELREQVIERRNEAQAADDAGEDDKARELTEQADRLLKAAESSPASRSWRERTFSQTKEIRNRLRQLERQASSLRREGKYDEASNVDREILSHLRVPLIWEAIAVVDSYAEEPIAFRYPFQHATAAEVLATLRELGNTLRDWIADERTNTIFARSPRIEVYQLAESIDELDQPANALSSKPSASPGAHVVAVENSIGQTDGETQTTIRQVPTALGAAVQAVRPHDPQRSDGTYIHVYETHHVRMQEALHLITIHWGLRPTVASGKIVVAGTLQEHEGIKALLAKLDVPDVTAVDSAPVNPGRGKQPPPNPPTVVDEQHIQVDEQHIQDAVANLRQAYADAERRVANLKAKIKPSAKPISKDNILRTQLRAAVVKAFETRQALLKAELIEFQQRMKQLERSIELRDRISDQIVDRRVEDLLNPSLNWDTIIPSKPTIGESVTPDELKSIFAARSNEGYPGQPSTTSSTTTDSAARETNDGGEDLARLQGAWSITKAYGPFERGIAPLDRKGTFRFEQDVVRIVWEAVQHLIPRREEAAARVVVRPGSPAGQLDIVWSYGDFESSLKCRYGWDDDRLILVLPYDGKDVSALLPRPDELRPARQTLYLELERVEETPPPSTGDVKPLPPLSLLVTHKGQPVENAIVDIFRQAYQPDAVQPDVERLGMTKTDANGRCQVPLGRAIWKQEPRSAYVIYVSTPDRTVRSLLINNDVGDGSIVRIDKDTHAWINLGESDHVQPGMTFSVYGKDITGMGIATSNAKGKLEVIRVLEPHLAEARPIEEDLAHPIAPGDTIYTPLWSPGSPDKYAVVGMLDLDDDGDSDRALFHKAMAMRGAMIVDEVDDAGNRAGRGIDASIKFLIIGQTPDISKLTNVTDRANARKILRHRDEMRDEARSHPVGRLFGFRQLPPESRVAETA